MSRQQRISPDEPGVARYSRAHHAELRRNPCLPRRGLLRPTPRRGVVALADPLAARQEDPKTRDLFLSDPSLPCDPRCIRRHLASGGVPRTTLHRKTYAPG